MEITLFSGPGLEFLFRWIHFLAGIVWIGILYYFNFVQVPFFAQTDAGTRGTAIRQLVPRALWWFRWGAMLTFLSGLAILIYRGQLMGAAYFRSGGGVLIQIGMLLGTLMFLNVWLLIWPNQKIVIASAEATAAGKEADPRAAGAGARAFVVSRTNALLSIPMLFFMGASSHLPISIQDGKSAGAPMMAITLIVLIFEANAIFGSKGKGMSKMLEKHVAVIHVGLVLALLFYAIVECML